MNTSGDSTAGPRPELRVGDFEREAAASALGDHFASGRLTHEEYDERSDLVWAARTNSDLWPLFADLPSPHVTQRSPATWRSPGPSRYPGSAYGRGGSSGNRNRRRLPLLPLLLIAVAVMVVLPGAPWLLFLLGGLWFAGCFGRGRPGHGRVGHGWEGHRRR